MIHEDRLVPARDHLPEVRVRHYRPADQDRKLPCLYWVHGGGHVAGSVDQDDPMLAHIVATVGCTVVSVAWRHSPEHPFPAALDDCYSGLVWTYEQASETQNRPPPDCGRGSQLWAADPPQD